MQTSVQTMLCLVESAIGYNGIMEPELIRKLLQVHKGHAIISLHKDTGVSDTVSITVSGTWCNKDVISYW